MSAYYGELESFPCRVIETNIERGRLPRGKVHCENIKNVVPSDLEPFRQLHLFAGIGAAAYACRLAGLPDDFSLCTFGFPCQDISAAGKGAGLDGSRSALFFEAVRIIAECRPTWLLAENVPALRTRGADRVLTELEGIGYTVLEPLVVGADDVGATHRRKRVWIVALRNEVADAHFAKCELPRHSRQTGRHQFTNGDPGMADAPELAIFDVCRKPNDFREPHNGAQRGRRFLGEGGADVAHAASGRGGASRSNSLQTRADTTFIGDGQLDNALSRRYRAETKAVRAGRDAAFSSGCWPARPDEPQHEWEHPRTIAAPQSSLGGATDGASARLVRLAEREWGRWRRDALKGLGNAWCPQTAVPLLRWMHHMETIL